MGVEFIYRIDGERVTQAEFRRRSRARRKVIKAKHRFLARGLGTTLRPSKVIESEALAVHPDDAETAELAAKRMGYGTVKFNRETGVPTFDNFSTRDGYAGTQGYHVLDTRHRKAG